MATFIETVNDGTINCDYVLRFRTEERYDRQKMVAIIVHVLEVKHEYYNRTSNVEVPLIYCHTKPQADVLIGKICERIGKSSYIPMQEILAMRDEIEKEV